MIGEDSTSDVALDDLSIQEGYCTGTKTGLGKGIWRTDTLLVAIYVVPVLENTWSRRNHILKPLSPS